MKLRFCAYPVKVRQNGEVRVNNDEGVPKRIPWVPRTFSSFKPLALSAYILGRPAGTLEKDLDSLGKDLVKGTNSIYGLEIDVNPEGHDRGCLFCNDCGNFLKHVTNEAASKSLTDFKGWIDLRMVVKGKRLKRI